MNASRKSPRVPMDAWVNKFIDGTPYLCRATDISVDGLYVGALLEPASGPANSAPVGLQFQLPGFEEVIYAEGEVVRLQGRRMTHGHGIRFTHLARRHRALIEQFVATRSAA